MAILIEAYSVVVRNPIVEAKYPGGMEAYERDCPNRSFCSDGNLSRIGFMVHSDAEFFVAELADKGLTPSRRGAAEDVAIVHPPEGALQPCDWLELGRRGEVALAWLAGSDMGSLHVPDGWSIDRRVKFRTAEEAREQLDFVESKDGLEIYREKESGRLLYVGRTKTSSQEDQARHNELYAQGCALIEGLIQLHGETPKELDQDRRRRLEEAVSLFEDVVRINPGNWAAMWLIGKIYQRFDDYPGALGWFARAHRVNPDNPDVAREASIAAMDSSRPREAVAFCERAIEANPDDPGLRANLALALLFSQRPVDAQAAVAEALRRDPADEVTALVARTIGEVLGGARPCPHHVRDLEPSA